MLNLPELINKLKAHRNVDAVFLTGSYGEGSKPYSDIDLVIILRKNDLGLTSLYTWIDHKFADVFFFDHSVLARIETVQELSGNDMDAVLVSWLQKAIIKFDKSGQITDLSKRIDQLTDKITVSKIDRYQFWQKINYNLVANTRYFESNDPDYLKALEVRLLYSVSEVFTGYFSLRGLVWRGEKEAIKYLQQYDKKFYGSFIAYTQTSTLQEKFGHYIDLVNLVFPRGYQKWKTGDVFFQPKQQEKANSNKGLKFWKEITGSDK